MDCSGQVWAALVGSGELPTVLKRSWTVLKHFLDGFGRFWTFLENSGLSWNTVTGLESFPWLWKSPARTLERSRWHCKAIEIDLEIVLEVSERSGWHRIALNASFWAVWGGLTPNSILQYFQSSSIAFNATRMLWIALGSFEEF